MSKSVKTEENKPLAILRGKRNAGNTIYALILEKVNVEL